MVFFVDDMGWADWQRSALNPEGSDVYETPNMQRLAERGVVFNNGYASAPVCSPTRVSLMTGKAPARHTTTDFIGAGDGNFRGLTAPAGWSQNLAASEVTMPEAFKAAGYTTGFFGKWHLGQGTSASANPLANGFDVNVGGVNAGNPGFAGGFFAGADGAWTGMPGLDTPGVYAPTDYLSDALSDKAADFIGASAASETPFFMNLSHYVVHTPIQAPADLVTKYANKIATLQGAGQSLGGHDNATYAAMVEKMDQSLGRVLDRLEDPNNDLDTSDSILDDTIVVFTSDNGGLEQFSVTDNRPLREGKGSVYEGGIREPYLVSWTGDATIQRGVVNTTQVATHDIYPTLLDLAGVAADPGQASQMDGVSFAGALRGQTLDRKAQVWHYPHRSPQDAGTPGASGGQFISAIRDGDWKLMWFYEGGRYELYNLAQDLGEQQNVLAQNPEKALELSVALRANLQDANAQMPRLLLSGGAAPPLEAPPLAVLAAPPVFDDFSTAHDFKTAGAAGTVWDGVENAGSASTFESMDGQLTLQTSQNTRLNSGDFSAAFLYEEWSGDFDARMEVGSMTSANFHVLAIVVSDQSDDFLWVGQQDRSGDGDFAQSRSYANGGQTELNLAGEFAHFRVVREGDEFRGYVSEDGLFWRQFTSFDRPDLPDTLRIGPAQASYGSATVTALIESFTLREFVALPGDFNDDGVVDAADYTVWRDGLGTTYNQADYDVWRASYGMTAADLATAATVPEPVALGLAAFACAALALRRHA